MVDAAELDQEPKSDNESEKSMADNEEWAYYYKPAKALKLLSKTKARWIPNSVLVGCYYLL